ncbi:phage gateway protein [Bordetella pseudohinzii]|uniref:Uncharacterized protein n=1 Tax=Bordetella pseudohinzii TaxID=1331258 RepID=A0A0J6BSQ6_9BORD|nr:hypothetical protein [Bordetella pseudohinzii]ANY17236.1 hypothetical protein BBN53_15945 [Bordetella pseudohinzii]KMM24869.1 hypothetical protein L540_03310 [Bordetella pseudohinzii]KXA75357.1 hypothetical protein AW877_20165 [Bordetella pseudohinzii]KXA75573.1 hypothetical protein AW878_19900 [Bordetella pseudohinzii]CUI96815.1 Uncharacterised protein [Bordetella pseudohinzii]
MIQKQLEATVRDALVLLLAEQGITLPVLAAPPRPTEQGSVDDGIYFFLLNRGKRGWQARKYHDDGEGLTATESQINESMYQYQAFVENDPDSPTQLLASDVLAVVRGVLQSMRFTQSMTAAGIGVQRATEIAMSSFVNEGSNSDFNPSFTIIFTHHRNITQATAHIEQIVSGIHRI